MRNYIVIALSLFMFISCQNQVYDFQFYKNDISDMKDIPFLWASGFIVTQVINNSSAIAQEIGGSERLVLMYDVDAESIFYDRQVIGSSERDSKPTYFYQIGLCKYKSRGQSVCTIPIIYMSSTMLDLYSPRYHSLFNNRE